jgi:hypothetical protein
MKQKRPLCKCTHLMHINSHERTNSAARFTNYTSRTLCEATGVHSATANGTTRRLSSFSPSLWHINISDEDRKTGIVMLHVCGLSMTGSEVKQATSTHNRAGCYGFVTFPRSPHRTFLGTSWSKTVWYWCVTGT